MFKKVLLILLAISFTGCTHILPSTEKTSPQLSNSPKVVVPTPTPTPTMTPVKIENPAQSAIIKTNLGDITIKLFPDSAPNTVENFAALSEGSKEWTNPKTNKKTTDPLYNGVIFHRIIPDFMIQGGDPLGTGTGGPGYRFADEIDSSLKFDKPYLLAMANAGPNTNGSQFFITTVPTPWLNGKHTIFGEVTKGQDIVDKIEGQETNPMNDKPVNDVIIQSITITR